ncbi:hypothetical protein [Streptodolium elevatio]|uniref:Uncharacterized protein n=1 Tax=Streptodolium elevatio TaxID=3157996 RepID=A0ABV3DMB8_9ACTN
MAAAGEAVVMAGIGGHHRPQRTARVLTVEERARREQRARLRQYQRALDDLLMDPDEWLDGLLPDRPEADTDEENP